jgi:hypothetical protein
MDEFYLTENGPLKVFSDIYLARKYRSGLRNNFFNLILYF